MIRKIDAVVDGSEYQQDGGVTASVKLSGQGDDGPLDAELSLEAALEL